MMSDNFIESVITPKNEESNANMVYREFRGLEAVAEIPEEIEAQDGGDDE